MSKPKTIIPKNVVIIIVESFAQEYIGTLNKDNNINNYQGYTPFIDSLIGQSLIFENSFANGRKSIDAMPSVLASIPSLSGSYVLSVYSNNAIKGLPALLKTKGYDCSFMHGAPNGSMGFQAFANMSGFDHYYGKNEYGNNADFDGWWGIWDEPFLQYCANVFSKKQQPFMASIFTISSHHPFVLPKQYENKFPKGTLPIHQCIGYTDYALRRFFETASKEPWFYNTLFIITADHTTNSVYEEYQTSAGNFRVPIIFYDPANENIKGVVKKQVVQQIDIMPTVLGFLNYDRPYLSFGFDVNRTQDRFAVNYTNGYYQLYTDQYVLVFDGKETTGLYQLRTDMSRNFAGELPEIQEEMEQKAKAFIQQYTTRMVENRLTVKP